MIATHQNHHFMESTLSLYLSMSGFLIPVKKMDLCRLICAVMFTDFWNSLLRQYGKPGATDGTRYHHALQARVELSQIQLRCSGGENEKAFSI